MLAIQVAWETLRSEEGRLEYDERLFIMEMDKKRCVFDEATLSEFEESEVMGQKNYQLDCRCGGSFIIEGNDLFMGFNLISCSNCTARTLIK